MKKSIIILLCLFWTLYSKAQGVEYQTFIYTCDELQMKSQSRVKNLALQEVILETCLMQAKKQEKA